MQKKYGKSQAELKEFCKNLSEVAYVKEKGEVTCEEWLNWIKLDQSEDTKSQTKNFIKTHSEFREWEKLFFKLSNGSMEINTTELEKYIKNFPDDEAVHQLLQGCPARNSTHVSRCCCARIRRCC